jgi:hypothetical protein
MIRQLLGAATMWGALLITGSLLSGCGGSNGASAAVATPHTTATITRTQAIAYSRAVNLRAADVPEMSIGLGEQEIKQTDSEKRSSVELTRCYGGVDRARRIAWIRSPEFEAGRARQSRFLTSRVEVWPTPGLAARSIAAEFSSRGQACFRSFLAALQRRLNKQRAGHGFEFGPLRVVTVPAPLPGVSRSFLYTIAETRLRAGRVRLHIYRDTIAFTSGPAEMEVEATGFSRPVPAATVERLVLLVLNRAKANML